MKKFLSALALVLAIAAPLSAQQKFKLFTQVVARPSGTTGDLFYVSDTTGTIARLPAASTQGQCLLSTGAPILPAWGACTAGGTVTSVGLALPGTLFSVSGSPVTGSGTLSGALLAQSANTIFAGPTSGGSTAPAFRLFVTADYPDESVTFAKMQNIATAKLLGRATAGAGDIEEITLGTGLSFAGTTLNAAGGGGGHIIQEAGGALTARGELNFLAGFDLTDNAGADSTDVAFDLSEVAGGGDLSWSTNTPTVAAGAITYAKMQDVSVTQRVVGRNTAGSGDPEEVTAAQLLDWLNCADGEIVKWASGVPGCAADAGGGGGASAQDFIDAVWLKKFFSDAGVLPATERIAASLAVFPTEAGVATGSFTKDVGHARFGTAPTTAYWDLGALRSEVLVVANLQLGEGIQVAIAVSAGVPASEYPDGYYFWQQNIGGTQGFRINKNVSSVGTTLGSVPSGLALGALTEDVKQPIGMALYYNDTTGVLKAFVRASSGSWFQVVSTTDSTFTTVRYVSLTWSKAGGGSFTGRAILPFAAWSD